MPGQACLACRKRPAEASHRLKIRAKAAGRPWSVMLCGVCLSAVRPLHPVAELLWFQGLGLDVLAEASALGGGRHLPGLPPGRSGRVRGVRARGGRNGR